MFLQAIEEYFEPRSVLDIGAHVGTFYTSCLKLYPNAYYYLIEANLECESYLQSLHVDYFMGVFSDKRKTINFYKNKTEPVSTGNSVYLELSEHFNSTNLVIEERQSHTLSEVLIDKQFDLIKLDVQGAEIDIMNGGQQIINSAKGIIIEVSLVNYNEGAPLEKDVMEYMDGVGFYPADEIGSMYDSVTHELLQRDILFINKNQGIVHEISK